MSAKITVARVYKITEGSALLSDITAGSPATGANLAVEAVTDFDIPTDGETRTVVIDSEQITYTDVDEDTDELVNITRGANSTTAASHTAGTFVQYGTTAKRHKLADGFIDDDDSMAIGVEILRHLWRYYPVGARDNADMELASVDYLDDGHPIIVDAPEDEDRDVHPNILPFTDGGVLSTGTRPAGIPMPYGGSIEEARIRVETAPVGASLIVDVLVDGVSILTTKPTITAGSTISTAVEPTDKYHTKGQIIQIEVEQVGSTTPGSNLTVYLTVFPTENATAGRIEVPGPAGPAGTNGTNGADGVISEVQNEGSALADQSIMNFTGAGVDVTVAGGKYVVSVPGGGTSFIGAALRANATQNITNTTWTAIAFDTEDFDTDTCHDNATNNTRLTATTAGYYDVGGFVNFGTNATGQRGVRIIKNGATTTIWPGDFGNAVSTGTFDTRMGIAHTIQMAVGDYIELQGWQNSGGTITTVASTNGSRLSWARVG